jgi:hypothetical protein
VPRDRGAFSYTGTAGRVEKVMGRFRRVRPDVPGMSAPADIIEQEDEKDHRPSKINKPLASPGWR